MAQVIRRVKKANLIDEVIVATTINPEDTSIEEVAKNEGCNVFRGSLENVLERYYKAAIENNLDVIIRITSDCPCADFNVIDRVIKNHLNNNLDYTSNSLIEHFPRELMLK